MEVKGFAIYRNKLPTDESCLTDKEAAEWVEQVHNLFEASARDLVNWDSAKSRCSKAVLATKISSPLKNEYHQDQRHAWDLRSAVMQAVEEHVELRTAQGTGKNSCSLENDPARWAYSTAGGQFVGFAKDGNLDLAKFKIERSATPLRIVFRGDPRPITVATFQQDTGWQIFPEIQEADSTLTAEGVLHALKRCRNGVRGIYPCPYVEHQLDQRGPRCVP